jgi:hypothetical protein
VYLPPLTGLKCIGLVVGKFEAKVSCHSGLLSRNLVHSAPAGLALPTSRIEVSGQHAYRNAWLRARCPGREYFRMLHVHFFKSSKALYHGK